MHCTALSKPCITYPRKAALDLLLKYLYISILVYLYVSVSMYLYICMFVYLHICTFVCFPPTRGSFGPAIEIIEKSTLQGFQVNCRPTVQSVNAFLRVLLIATLLFSAAAAPMPGHQSAFALNFLVKLHARFKWDIDHSEHIFSPSSSYCCSWCSSHPLPCHHQVGSPTAMNVFK